MTDINRACLSLYSGDIYRISTYFSLIFFFLYVQLEQLKAQESELKKQKSELARLGAGELIKVSQELLEEKQKSEDMLGVITQLENMVEMGKQEIETLR